MSLPLLYHEILGNGCTQFKYPFMLSHFPLIYHKFWHSYIKEFKPHARTHHIVIIILIIVVAMLTLYYFMTSQSTLILYYHAFMLALHTSLIFRALWLPQV